MPARIGPADLVSRCCRIAADFTASILPSTAAAWAGFMFEYESDQEGKIRISGRELVRCKSFHLVPQAFQFAYLAPGKLFGCRNLSRPRLQVALTAVQFRLPARNFLQ